jgi:ribosomal subunit interface protein
MKADDHDGRATRFEIIVRGRNVEVPDHFRVHVSDKIAHLDRYDTKIIRTDVELHHEKNRRQQDKCQHIEITCRSRGPVVRAEACAADFYRALDLAVEKLERRLRHAADRRRVHHGRRTPTSVAKATARTDQPQGAVAVAEPDADPLPDDGPGRIVREKEHAAAPMTVDQALFEMELVGHDFYLFADATTGRPTVVYRRHGYDYGLIRLADDSA